MTQAAMAMEPISEKDATEIISFVTGNVAEISSLANKVSVAQKDADRARNKVDTVKRAAEAAKNKTSSRGKTHWYSRKADAINNVQEDVKDLAKTQVEIAESQITLAEVQQRAAEAQALSFEFQKKLASATASMINFSTASIATSRMVIKELEARLNGASKEELSDLARKELETVVPEWGSLLSRIAFIPMTTRSFSSEA